MKFAALLLLLTSPLAVRATLVVLGDSFSDGGQEGNIPVATGGLLPGTTLVNERLSTGQGNVGFYPPAPYYYGRFTNGPVWIETAASMLGQAVDNFAAGGANGNAGRNAINVRPPFGYVSSNFSVPVRSLVDQADAYAALKRNARGFQDIVIIQIGPDEYYQKLTLDTTPPDPTETVAAVEQALNTTYAAGARKFVVVDLPPLSAFPFAATLNRNDIDGITDDHNRQLSELVASFNDTNSDAQVYPYDLSGLFQDVLANPSGQEWTSAFTNTTGYAYGTSDLDTTQASGFGLNYAANPDQYIFWDVVHPSKHLHTVVGQDFATTLRFALDANQITQPLTTSSTSAGSANAK